MPKEKRDHLFRLLASLDNHFSTDDNSPADQDRWRALKRHIIRMKDALDLVETTLRHHRERGIPLTDDEARKVEGYAKFGLEERE
jgi:hypothetical protein